jgi:hypothetical protein
MNELRFYELGSLWQLGLFFQTVLPIADPTNSVKSCIKQMNKITIYLGPIYQFHETRVSMRTFLNSINVVEIQN